MEWILHILPAIESTINHTLVKVSLLLNPVHPITMAAPYKQHSNVLCRLVSLVQCCCTLCVLIPRLECRLQYNYAKRLFYSQGEMMGREKDGEGGRRAGATREE